MNIKDTWDKLVAWRNSNTVHEKRIQDMTDLLHKAIEDGDVYIVQENGDIRLTSQGARKAVEKWIKENKQ